jgi:hypothetical protein
MLSVLRTGLEVRSTSWSGGNAGKAAPLATSVPFSLNRDDGAYSPVEIAIREALDDYSSQFGQVLEVSGAIRAFRAT